MSLSLFIDANVYLDFYHFSNDDIVELEKLVELIKKKKIRLLVTPQLKDELSRNRDVKLAEAMKRFEEQDFKCHAPVFARKYKEFSEIQKLLLEANKKKSKLSYNSRQDIAAHNLATDFLISNLLQLAETIDGKEKAFSHAVDRFRKGNPPGKKKVTIGDELNWEHLLLGFEKERNLHFVSGDSDYSSALNPDEFNSFLSKEWNERMESDVFFYRDLSQFCLKHFPQIKLVSDVELSMAIEKLASSGSFTTTHVAISMLSKFESFSTAQATELLDIVLANNQVSWIIEDEDVQGFYLALVTEHGKKLEKTKVEKLEHLLAQKFVPDLDDEVPF